MIQIAPECALKQSCSESTRNAADLTLLEIGLPHRAPPQADEVWCSFPRGPIAFSKIPLRNQGL
ncbi:MAG: hypothetical protein EBZ48_01775 [Proteobacteria bacterium]|nr:hypothetical protein [Pseudomonadota bacterium]